MHHRNAPHAGLALAAMALLGLAGPAWAQNTGHSGGHNSPVMAPPPAPPPPPEVPPPPPPSDLPPQAPAATPPACSAALMDRCLETARPARAHHPRLHKRQH